MLLSSPQEKRIQPEDWVGAIHRAMNPGRWCFAGALQAKGTGGMPDAISYVESFVEAFSPERIRVCFLSPDHQGRVIDGITLGDFIQTITGINNAECIWINGHMVEHNALVLADFFDFT